MSIIEIFGQDLEWDIDMITHSLLSEVLALSLTVSNWEHLLTVILQLKNSFFVEIVKAVRSLNHWSNEFDKLF